MERADFTRQNDKIMICNFDFLRKNCKNFKDNQLKSISFIYRCELEAIKINK